MSGLYPIRKNSLTLKLDALPQYSAFKGTWSYEIPRDFIDAVLTNDEVDEKTGKPVISDVCKASFKNNIVDRMRSGVLAIAWNPTKNVPYGRRYSGLFEDNKCVGSLGTCARAIKNSYYKREGWTDFDFVKCHPALICELVRNSGVHINIDVIRDYIDDFSAVANEFIELYSADMCNPLDTDDVKGLFNLTIYGGGFTSWRNWITTDDPVKNYVGKKLNDVGLPEFYVRFKTCIDEFRQRVIQDNAQLLEILIKANENKTDPKLKYMLESSLMSYYLQCAENHCLHYAYKYAVEQKWIEERKADLCYDGFTAKILEGAPSIPDMLDAMNDHIATKTGLSMVLKDKALKEYIPSIAELPKTFKSEEDDYCKRPDYLQFKREYGDKYFLIENLAKYMRVDKDANGRIRYYYLAETDLKTIWRQYYFTVIVLGQPRKISMVSVWLEDPKRKTYKSIECIPPPLVCPDNVFNTWGGSPFEDCPFKGEDDPEFVPDAVQMFVNHISDIVCDGDQEAAKYILCYFAHAIQLPSVKPNVMLVLQGEEGAGKSIIVELLGRMFHKGMFLQTAKPEEDVWGHFNGQMMSSYIVDLEEVGKSNSKGAVDVIKNMLTSQDIQINEKGVKKQTMNSYHRFISPTNSIDPYKITVNDRRMFFVNCSSKMKGNSTYFNKWMQYFGENPTGGFNNFNALRSLYWTLKNTENIDTWDFKIIPNTQMRRELIEESRPMLDRYLECLVMENYNEHKNGIIGISGKEFLAGYNQWCKDGGYSDDNNIGVLLKRLKREVKLPEGAYFTGKRTMHGYIQHFSMPLLIKHYNLGHIVCVNGEYEEA